MIEQLKALLQPAGLSLSEETYEKLQQYHTLLLDWNTRMDLTNVEEKDMALLHYADSLMPLSHTAYFPFGAKLIDVGTGAGFPGMVLAIARRDMQVTLLDSQQKRCAFLAHVVEELQLNNVEVVHNRAEDAGRGEGREKYHVVTARAVAPLNVLCEYLLPLVKVHGHAICWKGPSVLQEQEAAAKASEVLGGELGALRPLALPGREHYIQVFNKKSPTPRKYPRKAGTPSKNPL